MKLSMPVRNPLETFIVKDAPEQLAAASKVRIAPTPLGGTEFHTPAGRHLGLALTVGLMAVLAWVGLSVAIAFKAGFFIYFVVSMFGLILTWMAADVGGRSTRTRFEQGTITITQRWFGIGSTRKLHASEVGTLLVKSSLQSGNKRFYDVQLLSNRGQVIVLANALDTQQHAEWLLEEMNCCLKKQK
jgi:hypothetical protein